MPRTTRTIVAALALTAAGGTALTAGLAMVSATRVAREAVATLVAANPALRVGGVTVDPFGSHVILHDVAFARGTLALHVGRLSLPAALPPFPSLVGSALAEAADRPVRLAQWPQAGDKAKPAAGSGASIELKIPGGSPAPAAPTPPPPAPVVGTGTASASDVSIVRGDLTYTIKSIQLTGTSLSNADLTAMLDPGGPDPFEARLQKLNAASILIPSIVETQAKRADGGQERGEISQVLMANVAGGRIGAASAAGVSVTAIGTKPGPIVKTGAIQASGVDLASITRMVVARRTDDAEPLKPLSDLLAINDIAIAGDDGTLTIATISQKGLKGRPLKSDLRDLQAAANKSEPGDDPTARMAKTKAVLDDVAGSFELATFAIDKVLLATKDKNGPLTMAISSIGINDFAHRALGGFVVRAFALASTDVNASIDSLVFANIVVPPLNRSPDDPATAPATAGVPAVGKADLDRISVDAVTDGPDGTKSKVTFALAHFGATSNQTADALPSRGTFALDNLTFDLPSGDGPGAKQLSALGYKHLDLSAAMVAAYDAAQETLQIQKFLVSGVEMGSVNLAIDLGNVNKGVMSGNPSVAKASALAMLLKQIDLRVVNNGLFERAFDWKAKQDGKTIAEERETAIDLFTVALPEGLGNGPGIKAIGAAVAAFVTDPKSLHIRLASRDGLGVSDMGLINAPAELLDRLDIQADANK